MSIDELKAEVGDRVFYNGKEAEVVALSSIYDGTPTLQLVCVDDAEKTCTAKECDCISMGSWWHGSARSSSGIQY